jgi:hypothetical protein
MQGVCDGACCSITETFERGAECPDAALPPEFQDLRV